MVDIILIEPGTAGNIGAICRSMKNFGLHQLVLINPQCDHLSEEAKKRSKHAKELLLNAIVTDFDILEKYDSLIATTSQLGNENNLLRIPITPEQLVRKIKNINTKVGIVFGREGTGLSNQEIAKCDIVVTIPTSKEYPVLNLSHSVSIILYELYKESGQNKVAEHITACTQTEKEQIMIMVNQVLDDIDFLKEDMKKTQKIFWKRLIGKSFLTKREASTLMGFLRHLIEKNFKSKN